MVCSPRSFFNKGLPASAIITPPARVIPWLAHNAPSHMTMGTRFIRIACTALLLVAWAVASAQCYVIKVRTIQKFKHPPGQSISGAIREGTFVHLNASTTNCTYIVDLDRRKVRMIEGRRPLREYPIVRVFSKGAFFQVEARSTQGNFIMKFYRDDDDKPLLTVEFPEPDRVEGFFTGRIRWKRIEQQVAPLSARALERLERQSQFTLHMPED